MHVRTRIEKSGLSFPFFPLHVACVIIISTGKARREAAVTLTLQLNVYYCCKQGGEASESVTLLVRARVFVIYDAWLLFSLWEIFKGLTMTRIKF